MKISILFIASLFCMGISAQEKNTLLPSIWAWEIQANQRKIYILGELHHFQFKKESNEIISHSFGREIYDASEEVWIEKQQEIINQQPDSQKLSNQLKPETWGLVKAGFKRATDSMRHLESKQKEALLAFYIENIDGQDPVNAFSNLIRFENAGIKPNRPVTRFFPGLSTTLKIEELSSSKQKLKSIEGAQSIADAWWKECNERHLAEILINSALKRQAKDFDYTDRAFDSMQSNFFNDANNVDIFVSDEINDTPVDKLLIRCTSIPRTKNWMPKIIDTLNTKGLPVTFLVGISHIGGAQGILSSLKKEGYTGIKRIYKIN